VRRFARIVAAPGESRTRLPPGTVEATFWLSPPVPANGGRCDVRAEARWDAGDGAVAQVDLPALPSQPWTRVRLTAGPGAAASTLTVRLQPVGDCQAKMFVAQSEITPAVRASESSRPNLVLVVVDALRRDALDCGPATAADAPFATSTWCARGAFFASAWSTAPWTAPSVASMLTGLWPHEHGHVFADGDLQRLQPRVATLASKLAEAGYETQGVSANAWFSGPLAFGYDALVELFPRVGAAPAHRHADAVVDRALELLAPPVRQPFFLTLHIVDVHQPLEAHDPLPAECGGVTPLPTSWEGLERPVPSPDAEALRRLACRRALYRASLRFVDAQLARLDARLAALSLERNTFVVLVSDHGEEHWDHAAEEYAVRDATQESWGIDHGHSLYRELTQVPLLVVPPVGSKLRPGPRPGLVSGVDLFATLLALARAPVPANTASRDLWPMLEDPSAPGRDVVVSESVLRGRHRLAVTTPALRAIALEGFPPLVFDLADTKERSPVAAEAGLYERGTELLRRIEQRRAGKTGLSPGDVAALRAMGYLQ
jgi:arylsulfatase A-like enzyme